MLRLKTTMNRSWILDGLEHLRVCTCNSAFRKAAEGPESRGQPGSRVCSEEFDPCVTQCCRWPLCLGDCYPGDQVMVGSYLLSSVFRSCVTPPKTWCRTFTRTFTGWWVSPVLGPAASPVRCPYTTLHSLPQHRRSRGQGKDVQHEGQELWLFLRLP